MAPRVRCRGWFRLRKGTASTRKHSYMAPVSGNPLDVVHPLRSAVFIPLGIVFQIICVCDLWERFDLRLASQLADLFNRCFHSLNQTQLTDCVDGNAGQDMPVMISVFQTFKGGRDSEPSAVFMLTWLYKETDSRCLVSHDYTRNRTDG